MAKQIADKLSKGITPQQFREGMTKNKEAFESWYDRFEWESEDDREFFESLNNRDDLRVLILMADWCGDVVRNVPAVLRALENSGVPVEVLIMEEHLDTMDQFLTMGGRSVPIVIVADTGGHVLGQWGPRPARIQEPMVRFKQENTDREAPDYQDNLAETRKEIMRRYGEDAAYQKEVVRELRELFSSI
ncbi:MULTISPECIES: thioredoxin family protein [unclassified Paenibacillus]|uniref:thioredoxin family protein n=1 Tax=unclassified Paenibacillus TaxID=185978 RepID=UPI0009558189|nr:MULTISPECIES: thioredoxin family protein [unclassified Paenibacillus]ASS66751.1 thioredoxin family protein [Paenibacillus sp. RUD330]SIP96484.1 Thioredoxin [Paenibacillus sp. RU4X]SIQ15047.1 Thioredoxin [Paenibacillus sp. RU4T]